MVKLRLVVMTRGKWEGKRIPIARFPFLIGRDAACQLRPANTLVSNQHGAISTRDGRFFIRDLESTNGTFVNDERIAGERELQHGDALRIGTLDFDIEVETTAGVDRGTPIPPTRGVGQAKDAALAAILASLPDLKGSADRSSSDESEEVPGGPTEMDIRIRHPIEWEEVGDAVAVHFTERTIVDEDVIRTIGQQLLGLVEECNQRKVLLNLRNVRAMSTGMIEKLIALSQRVRAVGGQLALCNVQPAVQPMFQQFRLAKTLVIRSDEQEALQALR
jgi:anti-anti-sigma factor